MSAWDPRRLFDDEPLPRALVIVATVAFAALTLWVALHHEPWRDEADPWLYVRDADLGTILARTRYVGFPALWFLLLAPLPRLGLPYFSQAVLHLAIATAAVAILLAKLPLGRTTRLLLAFSYFFAYEYAVIVRSYALSILLIVIAAAMHRQRAARPISYAVVLALLFNVNAQGFLIGGTLAALFAIELWPKRERRYAVSVAIMAVAAVVSWMQVRTPPDPSRVGGLHALEPGVLPWIVGNAFFPTLPVAFGFAGGLVLILLLTAALWHSRASLFVFWLPFAALAFLHAYVYVGGLRHAGFVLVLAVLAISVADRAAPWPRSAAWAAVLLNLSLLVSLGVAARYAILDTKSAFSGAQEMGEYMRANGLDRFEIAAHNATQCAAILPYLPDHKQFWFAGIESYGSYMRWDTAYERGLDVPYPLAELRARQHFAGRPWLLLFNVEIPDSAAHGFRLLYANRRPVFEKPDERFWLYAPLR